MLERAEQVFSLEAAFKVCLREGTKDVHSTRRGKRWQAKCQTLVLEMKRMHLPSVPELE